jgi:hypothetical protein
LRRSSPPRVAATAVLADSLGAGCAHQRPADRPVGTRERLLLAAAAASLVAGTAEVLATLVCGIGTVPAGWRSRRRCLPLCALAVSSSTEPRKG